MDRSKIADAVTCGVIDKKIWKHTLGDWLGGGAPCSHRRCVEL